VLVGSATLAAKPLNAVGEKPSERLLSINHCTDHQVTGVLAAAAATALSPSTNAPRLGNANTIAVLVSSEEGR
jgi:hypothetical protein